MRTDYSSVTVTVDSKENLRTFTTVYRHMEDDMTCETYQKTSTSSAVTAVRKFCY